MGVVRDPARNHFPDVMARDDVIPSSVPWRNHWKGQPAERQAVRAH